MSQAKKSRKIITTGSKQSHKSKRSFGANREVEVKEMLFKPRNFYYIIGGLVVMALGFILMAGGKANPSPDVFDADSLYSFRRVFIAPLVILIGLGLNVYAIFKK